MKIVYVTILALFAFSCSEENIDIANIRINHFKQSAVGTSPTLALLIQEGDRIGSDEWEYYYSEIRGFEYEWGYVYDLKIKKETVDDPPQDKSSIEFMLEEIISKEAAEGDVTFDIRLKSGPEAYVTGGSSSGYQLLNEQEIDCSDLCQDMTQLLETEGGLVGRFTHRGLGKIQLQKLTVE